MFLPVVLMVVSLASGLVGRVVKRDTDQEPPLQHRIVFNLLSSDLEKAAAISSFLATDSGRAGREVGEVLGQLENYYRNPAPATPLAPPRRPAPMSAREMVRALRLLISQQAARAVARARVNRINRLARTSGAAPPRTPEPETASSISV